MQAIAMDRRLTPLDRTGQLVHESQPAPLPVVYVVTSPKKKNHRRFDAELHQQRFEKFQRVLRRLWPDSAEATMLYHDIRYWELWLCGFDPYTPAVFEWWQKWHVMERWAVILLSRQVSRDRLGKRAILAKIMRS